MRCISCLLPSPSSSSLLPFFAQASGRRGVEGGLELLSRDGKELQLTSSFSPSLPSSSGMRGVRGRSSVAQSRVATVVSFEFRNKVLKYSQNILRETCLSNWCVNFDSFVPFLMSQLEKIRTTTEKFRQVWPPRERKKAQRQTSRATALNTFRSPLSLQSNGVPTEEGRNWDNSCLIRRTFLLATTTLVDTMLSSRVWNLQAAAVPHRETFFEETAAKGKVQLDSSLQGLVGL